MATKKPWRPFYQVFLERVILIKEVQCHRAAAVTKQYEQFISEGRRLGAFPNNCLWSVDRPTTWPYGPIAPANEPMRQAWNAAITAFTKLIADLVKGELIAIGVHPAIGRSVLDPAEWTRGDQILDVCNGVLIDRRSSRVRWSAIALRAAKRPRQKKGRGHGYDWEGAWAYAKTLRAEDQWDWKEHRRHKKQPLPAVRKTVEDKIKEWFGERGSVPDIGDIRRNITIPLYAGRRTRGKRKR